MSIDLTIPQRVTSKTANYTAVGGELVLCDASGGSFTVTLPASPVQDEPISVKVSTVGSGSNTVTIDRNGKSIDGSAANIVLYVAGDFISLIYDGSQWRIISDIRQPHRCKLWQETGQAVLNNTVTKLTGLTSSFDVGKLGDTANSRIVIRRAGQYIVRASVYWSGVLDTGELAIVLVYVNGVAVMNIPQYSGATDGFPHPVAFNILNLAAGDVVELYCSHNEGNTQTTTVTESVRPSLLVSELRL